MIDSNINETYILTATDDSVIVKERSVYTKNRRITFFTHQTKYYISKYSVIEIFFDDSIKVFDFRNTDSCQVKTHNYSINYGNHKEYFLQEITIDSMHYDSLFGFCYIKTAVTFRYSDSTLKDLSTDKIVRTIYHPVLQDLYRISMRCYSCLSFPEYLEVPHSNADYLYYDELRIHPEKRAQLIQMEQCYLGIKSD